MKRLLLMVSFLSPALIGMEREELTGNPTTTTTTTTITTSTTKEATTLDLIKKYVNLKKLFLIIAEDFFTDGDSSSSSSGSSEEVEKNVIAQKLINALIESLKLERYKLSLNISQKQLKIPLKAIFDIKKLRGLFTDISSDFFERIAAKEECTKKTDYIGKLVECIKMSELAKKIGKDSTEYKTIEKIINLLKQYSSGKIQNANTLMEAYALIQELCGINFDKYLKKDKLQQLIESSLHNRSIDPVLLLDAINPVPFLVLCGCSEEDAKPISEALGLLLIFAYDLAQDEEATLTKMTDILVLYATTDFTQEQPTIEALDDGKEKERVQRT